VKLDRRKDLLGIKDLSKAEIDQILHTAAPMKDVIKRDIKKVPTLRGKAMVTVFYENSTRTRTSFEIAGKYLSADTVNLAVSTSSVQKGESLRDTIKTIEVLRPHSDAPLNERRPALCSSQYQNAGDQCR
jgi:aspartate carbamoyltransferase catalytic subunit